MRGELMPFACHDNIIEKRFAEIGNEAILQWPLEPDPVRSIAWVSDHSKNLLRKFDLFLSSQLCDLGQLPEVESPCNELVLPCVDPQRDSDTLAFLD